MPHRHSVYDTDPYFVLKKQTRELTDKSTTPTRIIQYDHNCERITLELPRHIDGHDMLQCNSVQVHYINIDASTKEEKKGVYEVTDLQQSADDENKAFCSWLISGNATQHIGALYFVWSFRCIGDDGSIDYNFNTARYDLLSVSTGINNTDYVAEEYADILEQWKAEIDEALAQGGGSGLTAEQAADLAANTKARHTHNRPLRLKEEGRVIESYEITDDYVALHLDPLAVEGGLTLPEVITIPLGVTEEEMAEYVAKEIEEILKNIPESGDGGDLSQFIEEISGSVNLYPPMTEDWLNNTFITSNGKPTTNDTSYKNYLVTPLISVEGGKTYTVKPTPWIVESGTNVPSVNRARTYDNNGTPLASMTFTDNADGSSTFTVPVGSETIRMSVLKGKFGVTSNPIDLLIENFNNVFMLVEGTTAPEKYEPYGQGKYRLKDIELPLKSVNLENVNDKALPIFAPLAGKKIANFGDSIFGNARPPEDVSTYLAEKTGAEVLNCAFGGCRMAIHNQLGHWNAFTMVQLAQAIASGDYSVQDEALNYDDRTSYAEQPLSVVKATDFSTVDILTIAYGTNDFTSNISLDNAENPYDTATFAGALRTSVESLLTAYPNLKIFVLSTMYRFYIDENNEFTEDSNTRVNSIGLKLGDYNAKLKEVAKEYNLPYVDNYNIGIGKFNRYQYFNANDGTHHKEEGRKLIVEHLATGLSMGGSVCDSGISKVVISTTSAKLNANKVYDFGTATELTITFDNADPTKYNEYNFTFTSGETPTVLSLPSSVKWVNELIVEANKRYEISIVDNIGLWCAVDLAVTAE